MVTQPRATVPYQPVPYAPASPETEAEQEPTYNGRPYAHWLNLLRVEREPEKLLFAVIAMEQLGSEHSAEAARAVLSIMRNVTGGRMPDRVMAALASMNRDDVVTAVLEEFSQGNARSRDFILKFVEWAIGSSSVGDRQRLREAIQKHGVEFAQARLANPPEIDLERATVEQFLLLLARILEVNPTQVPGMLDVLSAMIEGYDVAFGETNVLLLVLAEFAPESPGLVEKVADLRPRLDNHTFAQIVMRLGRHAAPIVPQLVDSLHDVLTNAGFNSSFYEPDSLRMLNPIIAALGEMGPEAQPAEGVLKQIVDFTKSNNRPRDTLRLAEAALDKIKGGEHTRSRE